MPPPDATANDFHPEVLRLFDQYVHGQIDRRGFLSKAARFAVGTLGAEGLLEALSPRYDQQAAQLAWSRTIEFFKRNLQ